MQTMKDSFGSMESQYQAEVRELKKRVKALQNLVECQDNELKVNLRMSDVVMKATSKRKYAHASTGMKPPFMQIDSFDIFSKSSSDE